VVALVFDAAAITLAVRSDPGAPWRAREATPTDAPDFTRRMTAMAARAEAARRGAPVLLVLPAEHVVRMTVPAAPGAAPAASQLRAALPPALAARAEALSLVAAPAGADGRAQAAAAERCTVAEALDHGRRWGLRAMAVAPPAAEGPDPALVFAHSATASAAAPPRPRVRRRAAAAAAGLAAIAAALALWLSAPAPTGPAQPVRLAALGPVPAPPAPMAPRAVGADPAGPVAAPTPSAPAAAAPGGGPAAASSVADAFTLALQPAHAPGPDIRGTAAPLRLARLTPPAVAAPPPRPDAPPAAAPVGDGPFLPPPRPDGTDPAEPGAATPVEAAADAPADAAPSAETAADAPSPPPPPITPTRRPAALAGIVAALSDPGAVFAPRPTPRPRLSRPAAGASGAAPRGATVRVAFEGEGPRLLGVTARDDGVSALMQTRDGAIRRVSRGDRVDGWTVASIGEDRVRLRSDGRSQTLRVPRP